MKRIAPPSLFVTPRPVARVGHRPVPRALRILPDKTERRCGSCQECCTVGHVPEIGKPPGVKCEHLRRGKPGCSLHGSEQRPESCGAFKCLWLQGVGPDSYRPDRTGIYLVLRQEPGAAAPTVLAFETHRFAARSTGRAMLDELRRSVPVGVVPFPEAFPRHAPPITRENAHEKEEEQT